MHGVRRVKAAVWWAGAMLVAVAVANAQRPQELDAAAVERGRAQFKANCGFCHGDDATGNRGPDLIRSPVLSHDANGDQLGPVIRNGRARQGMPGVDDLRKECTKAEPVASGS